MANETSKSIERIQKQNLELNKLLAGLQALEKGSKAYSSQLRKLSVATEAHIKQEKALYKARSENKVGAEASIKDLQKLDAELKKYSATIKRVATLERARGRQQKRPEADRSRIQAKWEARKTAIAKKGEAERERILKAQRAKTEARVSSHFSRMEGLRKKYNARVVAIQRKADADARRRRAKEEAFEKNRVKEHFRDIESIRKKAAARRAALSRSKDPNFFNGNVDSNKKVPNPSVIGSAFGSIKDRIKSYGAFIVAAGALRAAIGLLNQTLVAGVKRNIEFEKSIADIAAVTGDATDVLTEGKPSLVDSILEVASATTFSVKETAAFVKSMARLGFETSEIQASMLNTARAAQALGVDFGTMGEVVGKTLNAFGLGVSESSRVTDTLVSAINSSALTFEQFQLSMQYVAPIARQLNVSLEETTFFMAKLSDAGFKSSKIGTGLRQIFIELGSSSSDLVGDLKDLSESNLSLADAEELVGKRAAAQFLVLLNGIDDIDAVTQAYKDSEAANFAAAKQMDTTAERAKQVGVAWDVFTMKLTSAISTTKAFKSLLRLLDKQALETSEAFQILYGEDGLGGRDAIKDDRFIEGLTKEQKVAELYVRGLEASNKTMSLTIEERKRLVESVEKIGTDDSFLGVEGRDQLQVLKLKGKIDFGLDPKDVKIAFKGLIREVDKLAEETLSDENIKKGRADALRGIVGFDDVSLKDVFSVETFADLNNKALDEVKKLKATEEELMKTGKSLSSYDQGRLSEYQSITTQLIQLNDERMKSAEELAAYNLEVATLLETDKMESEILALNKEFDDLIKKSKKKGADGDVALLEEQRLIQIEAIREEYRLKELARTKAANDELIKEQEEKLAEFNKNLKEYHEGLDEFNKGQELLDRRKFLQDFLKSAGQVVLPIQIGDESEEYDNDLEDRYKKEVKNKAKSFEEQTEMTRQFYIKAKELHTDAAATDSQIDAFYYELLAEFQNQSLLTYKEFLAKKTKERDDADDDDGKAAKRKEENIKLIARAGIDATTQILRHAGRQRLAQIQDDAKAELAVVRNNADIQSQILRDRLEKDLISEQEYDDAMDELNKERADKENEILKKQFEAQKKYDKQLAAARFAEALGKIAINNLSALPTPVSVPAIAVGVGMAGVAYGLELDAINSRKFAPTRFATGGMIGGNLHSSGGTIIEAERDEYIINRGSTHKNLGLVKAINDNPNVSFESQFKAMTSTLMSIDRKVGAPKQSYITDKDMRETNTRERIHRQNISL